MIPFVYQREKGLRNFNQMHSTRWVPFWATKTVVMFHATFELHHLLDVSLIPTTNRLHIPVFEFEGLDFTQPI